MQEIYAYFLLLYFATVRKINRPSIISARIGIVFIAKEFGPTTNTMSVEMYVIPGG